MSVFVGIHKLASDASEDYVHEIWAKYKEACTKRGIKAIRLGYNTELGKACCFTEASSEDDVRAVHQEISSVPDEIFEVNVLE